jgi:RHS repeat-associated protein
LTECLEYSITYGNGLNDVNTYTTNYELDVLGVYNGAASVINRSHTRTDAQNLTNIFDNVTPAYGTTFAMSNANRLQNATGVWGTKTFTYDGVGNRTQEVWTPPGAATTTDTYAYPSTSNRVVQITRGAQTLRQMTYDGAGNLLTDGGNAYTYNNRNRMSVATIGAIVWNYFYNGREQLAIRSKLGTPYVTTHFIQDIFGNIIAEANGTNGGTTREYIWLPEAEIAPADGARSQVDRPIAVVSAVNTATPATWYVSVDHLNRPIKMTDAAKASVWDAFWLPFGGGYVINSNVILDARLPGQWFQAETGLHYNWHRQYDPTVGRYTQPDPLGFVDGPSVYAYVNSAAQQRIDPKGLRSSGWDPRDPKCYEECVAEEEKACWLAGLATSTVCLRQPTGPLAGACMVAVTCGAKLACMYGMPTRTGGTGAYAHCKKICTPQSRPGN